MLDLTRTIAAADLPAAENFASLPVPVNDGPLLDAYSNAVVAVSEKVGPAVVRVDTRGNGQRGAQGGTGSGIVISPDGLVLTNNHVVGSAREIRLSNSEGLVTDARVLGVDPDTDLALVRADTDGKSPAARSEERRVGKE